MSACERAPGEIGIFEQRGQGLANGRQPLGLAPEPLKSEAARLANVVTLVRARKLLPETDV